MDSQGTRNFFAEYVIAQAIELANDERGPIKYSTGRMIRNDVMRHFGSYNFEMKDMLPVLQEKLSERLGGYQIPNINNFYKNQIGVYQNYLIGNMLPIPI